MKVDGACHCGQITFTADIEPERVVLCHCTDCQTLSGSAFRVIVFTREDGLTITAGTIKTYTKIAQSGRPREQGFCGNCGTGLYATSPGEGPKVYGVRVGALRQRDVLKPTRQIWSASAQRWLANLADLPAIAGQP